LYLTVQYQIYFYKNLVKPLKVILSLSTESIAHQPAMSLSSDSLSLHRKCTATEHALNNADPLIVKKKARQAASRVAGMTAAKPDHYASVHMQCDNSDFPSDVGPGMPSMATQPTTAQKSALSVS